MSLFKTAFACFLLAALAPLAQGQSFRPANSRVLGQNPNYSSPNYYGGSPSVRAVAMNGLAPMNGPRLAQNYPSNAIISDSEDGAWTSDSPDDGSQSDQGGSSAPIYDPPDEAGYDPSPQYGPGSNWSATPPGYCQQGNCQGNCGWNAGACGAGNCTDTIVSSQTISSSAVSSSSNPSVSSWLGTYRFGGGNPGFAGPFYIAADVFALYRNNGNANIPITVDNNTGNTLLSAQNMHFDMRVGPRLTFGWAICHTTAVEFTYWGLIDSRSVFTVNGNGNLNLPGDVAFVATDFFAANQVNVSYNGRANSGEFNVLRNTGSSPLSWLYGFRYFNLNEHLGIASQGLLGTANYNVMTRNNMFGIQGGARWIRTYKCLAMEATFKGGVVENATEQTQTITDSGVPFVVRPTISEKGANTSFLAEANLNAIYRLGEHWAIRGGYTILWLDGLALAANQLDYTYTTTSGTGLNHGGNLLLQAVSAGVEFHW
ncbi:MAG TPA: BBP7 family outer membrane beta-barrel protein [Pirellulales bacterium]|nr:BBP7 family outer membrane beta-barrel protein [Pirellulales bacterium]